MRYLFEVTREIEFLTTFPVAISLHDKSQVLSPIVKMTLEECALPVENKDVRRVQQSKESNAEKDVHRDPFRAILRVNRRVHHERGHLN